MATLKAAVARIDDKLDRLIDSVRELRAGVAEIRGRITQLPTAWQLGASIVGIAVAVSGAVVGGVFAALRYSGHG